MKEIKQIARKSQKRSRNSGKSANQYLQWQDLKSDSPKQNLYNIAECECRNVSRIFCEVMKVCKKIEHNIKNPNNKERIYDYVEELVYMKSKFFYEDYIGFIDKLDYNTLVVLLNTSSQIKELCSNLTAFTKSCLLKEFHSY